MKRQFLIATLAAAAVGVAGCGNEETAGRDIGYGIGSLQATTATRTVGDHIEGIGRAIDSLKGQVPDETLRQMEQIETNLERDLKAAVNHPEALAAASAKAAAAFAALPPANETVKNLQQSVRKAYAAAVGEAA